MTTDTDKLAAQARTYAYDIQAHHISDQLADKVSEILNRCAEALSAAERVQQAEPVAWAATSDEGKVEALGFNQSRRFDTPLYLAAAPSPEASNPAQAEAPSYAPLTGRTHDLKIDGPVFSEVVAGRKLFEIRKNDRGFQCGDLLRLRETRLTGAEMAAGEPLIYTGNEKTVRVIGIVHGPKYGLAEGFCVMSIAAHSPASGVVERP